MYQSKICYFLALIIFFCGCYQIIIETDYLGEMKQSANSITAFNADENRIADEKISATEILNTYGLSVGKNILHQFKAAKKVVRLSWSFLVIQIFNFFSFKFIVAACFMEILRLHKNEAVLQYIHDIDGKK